MLGITAEGFIFKHKTEEHQNTLHCALTARVTGGIKTSQIDFLPPVSLRVCCPGILINRIGSYALADNIIAFEAIGGEKKKSLVARRLQAHKNIFA